MQPTIDYDPVTLFLQRGMWAVWTIINWESQRDPKHNCQANGNMGTWRIEYSDTYRTHTESYDRDIAFRLAFYVVGDIK